MMDHFKILLSRNYAETHSHPVTRRLMVIGLLDCGASLLASSRSQQSSASLHVSTLVSVATLEMGMF